MTRNNGTPAIAIIEALTESRISDARILFREYAASLGIDLCFQGFEHEVQELPGKYALPGGGLFVALIDEQPVGCVAVRPLDVPGIAELKRLYVRPVARGQRVGLALTRRAIEQQRPGMSAFVWTPFRQCSMLSDSIANWDSRRFHLTHSIPSRVPHTWNWICELGRDSNSPDSLCCAHEDSEQEPRGESRRRSYDHRG